VIIKCRFRNESDFNDFKNNNRYNISKDTKCFNIDSGEFMIKNKVNLFREREDQYKQHWKNMPRFGCNGKECYATISFEFQDIANACKIFSQKITNKTKSVWFPEWKRGIHEKIRIVGGTSNTRYPVYVVSKNRSNVCYTSKRLSLMEVPHYVVVEQKDYNDYVEKVQNEYATILILDKKYQDNYDTFDNLGYSKSKGPGAARNFCWEHSINNGFAWHWVMDDNTTHGFYVFQDSIRKKCVTGEMFKACEDFVDRYENIAIAGLDYKFFCPEISKHPPYILNTRIYSYLLIRNDIPYRWRGRYNEDTDLSLRVLKDGWCTVQFVAFLAGKAETQVVKGGNTEDFYSKEGTSPKSEMLYKMHPDVVKLTMKYNRAHHYVDYKIFKQELKLKNDQQIPSVENDYNMVEINIEEKDNYLSKSYLENKYLKS
jgi:hypothetical protein